jgi:hypothetical protein
MTFVAVLLSAIDELPDFGKVAAGYRPLLDGDHDIRVRRVNDSSHRRSIRWSCG